MVEDFTYNHMAIYSKTHPIHHKLTAKDKLNIKTISATDTISGEIINKF